MRKANETLRPQNDANAFNLNAAKSERLRILQFAFLKPSDFSSLACWKLETVHINIVDTSMMNIK